MNAFDKHIAAIKSGEVTKTNVIGMRKTLNAADRRYNGWSVGSTAPNVPQTKINAALAALEINPPRVVGDLHDSGVKLLNSPRYRQRLAHVKPIIDSLASFHLFGFAEVGDIYVPIYIARARDGREFKFINIPWQSGGNGPELI